MKYGVAVSVICTGYVEVIADSSGEAKAIAEQMAVDGGVMFNNIEPQKTEIEAIFSSEHKAEKDDGEVNLIKAILSSEEK